MILENGKIRKWDEIQGMTIEGYEKRINTEEVAGEKPVLCIIPAMTVEGAEQEKSPSIRKIIRELSLLQQQRKHYRYSHENRFVEFEILEREWY